MPQHCNITRIILLKIKIIKLCTGALFRLAFPKVSLLQQLSKSIFHVFFFRITYSGRGLKNGDCGIKISKLRDSDNGIWSCLTQVLVGKYKNDVYTNIKLTVSSDSGM